MFERMEISESIYYSVVETSYKKCTISDTTHAIPSKKNRGEALLSLPYSAMSKISGKSRKI